MNFKELGHKYISNEGKQYRSITGILKELEPKKDWGEIAKKYAIKNSLTLKEVQDKWQHEKDIAAVRGTKYHSSQEAKDLALPFAVTMDRNTTDVITVFPPTIIDGVKIGTKQTLSDGLYPELMVWLDSIEIAGQVDRPEIVNNTLNILDYKTNKKIDLEGWSSKWKPAEKLLWPCNHLDNCNYNLYSLQLNFYAYIILRHNPKLKLGKLIIRHILFEEGSDIPVGEKDYEVKNMQKEIRNVVKAIKDKKL